MKVPIDQLSLTQVLEGASGKAGTEPRSLNAQAAISP